MLPDFPSIKSDLINLVNRRLRHHARMGAPAVAMIRHTFQHEGDRMIYSTVEGSRKEVDYKRVESSLKISRNEIKTLTMEDIIKRIDATAKEFAGKMERGIFSSMAQATKEAGTDIDYGGKPFSFETLLTALDTISIDFDEETKQPHMPAIFMGPELYEKIKDKLPEWEKNEEYKKRWDEVLKRKYEEWYARESNRKLVD